MSKSKELETSILVTGASGFIGQYFLERIKNHFKVFALARRLPQNSSIVDHPNITWIQADISSDKAVRKAAKIINDNGGIKFILHLAGYYDFNYDKNPEYYRTNVLGTRNVLEMAKNLNIERFMFASSIAACEFPLKGEKINEKTPPDANFEYAVTKKAGEELSKEYSKYFKTSILRFAAAFSDWGEYGPLYIFLKTWLSKSWKSTILGGKGEAAITYIHVNCLIDLILKIIRNSDELLQHDTYVVSPNRPVSHNELLATATRYFFGKPKKPFHMPKTISYVGVVVMNILGRLIGKAPFEKPWMMQYIDKELNVDNTYTRETLKWEPSQRYKIQRRLLYMIEHMKSYPYEWQKRNLKMSKYLSLSPNYKIYEKLENLRDSVIEQILEELLKEENRPNCPGYHSIDISALRKDTITIYQFLSVSVRTRDRVSPLAYARQIAFVRSDQNFKPDEVLFAIKVIGEIVTNNLLRQPELKGMGQAIHDDITLTIQLMADEIESTFELIARENQPII
ncbi:MAG: NAD(P)-dependent oxidoreductase [Melioribacteraceae bacterium]|nr:NAD(P)-dependent oxidoreductase [Melioribacteraceae bacterium]MCF8265449.1 NAD(P)-dependent oxidoreductase [Melioribacteraceae bacterium]MCF8431389.1 NAD(P)-dependent oxidoreductase [Melioribacteraceae bacterium]